MRPRLEMAGASLTLCQLDDELERLLNRARGMRLLEGLAFMETTSGFTTATLAEASARIAKRMESSAEELNALDRKAGRR